MRYPGLITAAIFLEDMSLLCIAADEGDETRVYSLYIERDEANNSMRVREIDSRVIAFRFVMVPRGSVAVPHACLCLSPQHMEALTTTIDGEETRILAMLSNTGGTEVNLLALGWDGSLGREGAGWSLEIDTSQFAPKERLYVTSTSHSLDRSVLYLVRALYELYWKTL